LITVNYLFHILVFTIILLFSFSHTLNGWLDRITGSVIDGMQRNCQRDGAMKRY
jgi:hypothetical protein